MSSIVYRVRLDLSVLKVFSHFDCDMNMYLYLCFILLLKDQQRDLCEAISIIIFDVYDLYAIIKFQRKKIPKLEGQTVTENHLRVNIEFNNEHDITQIPISHLVILLFLLTFWNIKSI